MSKTTIKIMNKPSVAAQRKAWNILAKAYGERHGVELELKFSDEEKLAADSKISHEKGELK